MWARRTLSGAAPSVGADGWVLAVCTQHGSPLPEDPRELGCRSSICIPMDAHRSE